MGETLRIISSSEPAEQLEQKHTDPVHGRKVKSCLPLHQELAWQQLWGFLMKQPKSKTLLSAFVLPL